MKKSLVVLIAIIMLWSSFSQAQTTSLGQWWMEPIKEWNSNESFTLWFSPQTKQSLHFCLNTKAKWSKIGDGEFHTTVGSWIHYWVDSDQQSEVTFEGSLPDKLGKITLVTVTTDKFRCGKEKVNIEIKETW